MAGIGFELRKLLREDSYFGVLKAYGFAGIIGSGPWVLSILSVMMLGLFSITAVGNTLVVTQFLVSVTYLMAASLVLTGAVQLMFTRWVSDRLFEKKDHLILPNLIGLLTCVNAVLGGFGLLVMLFAFPGESALYRLLMLCAFMLLSNIWIATVFLGGMKAYNKILLAFAVGYGLMLALGLMLRSYGLEGLLAGFTFGQGVLLFLLLNMILREYPSGQFFALDFLDRRQIKLSLVFTGLFYNAAIWADKVVFWFNPATSEPIIGPLRASPIYDLPLFLAYLSIIPGMAVFLVRMETDFAESYERYYDAVRDGDTLRNIEHLRSRMIATVRQGIAEIFKIQGMTVLLLILAGPAIMRLLGVSALYVPLFNIDIVAVGVQVLLLAILNVFFYLDKLKAAFGLCGMLLLLNIVLTLVSQQLGISFYGYGYALSLTITSLAGLYLLNGSLTRLSYETFMFQRT